MLYFEDDDDYLGDDIVDDNLEKIILPAKNTKIEEPIKPVVKVVENTGPKKKNPLNDLFGDTKKKEEVKKKEEEKKKEEVKKKEETKPVESVKPKNDNIEIIKVDNSQTHQNYQTYNNYNHYNNYNNYQSYNNYDNKGRHNKYNNKPNTYNKFEQSQNIPQQQYPIYSYPYQYTPTPEQMQQMMSQMNQMSLYQMGYDPYASNMYMQNNNNWGNK
jgi:hypothetical protein